MSRTDLISLTEAKRRAKREGWLRWIRSPADEQAARAGCRFDLKRAEHVIDFFRTYLRHSKGEWRGQPFEPLDWQRDDVLMPLFGWVREDGTRRYRQTYIELPKKNGKSTLAAGVGLYGLAGDGEGGAEIYSAATKRDQASIVHNEAINMVRTSPELLAELTVNLSTRHITYESTGSKYVSLSSDAAGSEGLNAHFLIIDELHAWRGRTFWDALAFAGAARRQPLKFVITTAGDDLTTVCRQQHEYARQVLAGQAEDIEFFAYIRAASETDNPASPRTWAKANPSLGETITVDNFQADHDRAKKSGPSSYTAFKRYRLNIWSQSDDPWLEAGVWEACFEEFRPEQLAGRECYAGVDLSLNRDTAALALWFPDDEGDGGRVLARFWLPEARADHDSQVPYRDWAAHGAITLTDGEVLDLTAVTAGLIEARDRFGLKVVGYDPWNFEQIRQDLIRDHGWPEEAFVSVPQTWANIAPPFGRLSRLVREGKARHDGNPVLAWQASNVRTKSDNNGNERPIKPADHRKIDGIVAETMSQAVVSAAPVQRESIYETRGLL